VKSKPDVPSSVIANVDDPYSALMLLIILSNTWIHLLYQYHFEYLHICHELLDD
jgi:hypothetical protein